MKQKMTVIILVLLLMTNVVQATEIDYYNKNISTTEIKKEIDKLNNEIQETNDKLLRTDNGVIIYTIEDINKLDNTAQSIVLWQEIMRRRIENDIIEFKEIVYPLVSEVEQYGIKDGYTKALYTDDFFEDKINNEYTDIRIDYEFFKEVEKELYIKAIEVIDFIDLENTQIVFHPYKLLSSYAYCYNYAPEDINIRRTRVYYNPVEGEDIISTLYHELGHLVYFEMVEGNEKNYKENYKIYEEEYDTHNGADSYGAWNKKLTENFAEDFKIYLTKRVMLKDDALSKLIQSRETSFLSKDTVYEIKEETIKYFDRLIGTYKVNKKGIKPDTILELKDYNKGFKIYDTSFLGNYPNKIVTNSRGAKIKFVSGDYLLKPTKYKIRTLDKKYYDTVREREVEIKDGATEIEIRIAEKEIHEIIIEFGDKATGYKEEIKYYIIKM